MEKKTIGRFMAALRKSNGMTQQDVANRLNVSNKTVSKWERDESYPEITLITVIAELFHVTADEILRGERILNHDTGEEKTAVKVDKQIKLLLNSSITRFKNVSYMALALTFVGFICLFTIAYASYRPVIAFGVFLLFIVASVTLELTQVNLTHAALANNDLLEGNDKVLAQWSFKKQKYAFAVFNVNSLAVVFALPFILVRDSYYMHSVISIKTYLSWMPVLAIISFILFKIASYLWRGKWGFPKDHMGLFASRKMTALNVYQGGLIVIAWLFVLMGALNLIWQLKFVEYLTIVGFFLTVAVLIASVFFFTKRSSEPKERFVLLAAGIRNMIYGFAGMMAFSGLTSWRMHGGAMGYNYNIGQLLWASWIIIGATALYAGVKYLLSK